MVKLQYEDVSNKNTLPQQIETLAHVERLKKSIEDLEKSGSNLEKEQQHELEAARSEIRKLETETTQQIEQIVEGTPYSMPEQKQQSYKKIMQEMRQHLPRGVNRQFSRFIHRPSVEKISDIADKTIMRPSVVLGGSIGALLGGGLLYITAKRYGFTLSGSELIVTGLLGGVLGALLEGLSTPFRKKKRR